MGSEAFLTSLLFASHAIPLLSSVQKPTKDAILAIFPQQG